MYKEKNLNCTHLIVPSCFWKLLITSVKVIKGERGELITLDTFVDKYLCGTICMNLESEDAETDHY